MEEGMSRKITKKRRFDEFDFEKCLEDSSIEPPPEITVLKKGVSAGDVRGQHSDPEKVRKLSEQDLRDAIQRMKGNLREGLCSKLPDKGVKFKANLRLHLQEWDRRRAQDSMKEGASECVRVEDMERSRPSGASIDEDPSCQATSLSDFTSVRGVKMETGSTSCDAFDKDLKTTGCGARRKRKEQKARFTYKEKKKKNGLSWKGKEKPKLVSIKMFSCDVAENNEIHNQKDARQVLHSDRSTSEKTVVLLDEDEPDLGDATVTAEVGLRDSTIYYPSREDPECVGIQFKDLNCLEPGEYLTSAIMNFYIRFMQGPSFAANNASDDYHFFNTYFYKKLQEAVGRQMTDKKTSFLKLRRWWKGVKIFEKAYIFLPVHEDLHWSLVIVCNPDRADGCGPIILHLDSLGYHSSRSIFQNIRRFLKEEWDILKEESDPPKVSMKNKIWKNLPRNVEEKIITVPQQNNDSDCGLFVLYFMERFIEDAPQRLRKQDLGMFGRRWFKPEEASNLRGKIKAKLNEEFQKLVDKVEPVNSPSNGDSEPVNSTSSVDSEPVNSPSNGDSEPIISPSNSDSEGNPDEEEPSVS